MAMGVVRHVGEPVAAVAAVDEATAESALALIDVEYEELPVVATIEEALAPGAPLIHEAEIRPGLFHGLALDEKRDGNVCYRYAIDQGDVDALFAGADIVVEGDYQFPGVYQYSMETHTVVADASGTAITVWSTCQHPFLVRAEDLGALRGAAVASPRHRALPRRWVRQQVLHEDGAGDGRAGEEGRTAGAYPEPCRRIDGDHASARGPLPHAHRGRCFGTPAGARRQGGLRYRRLRRQRSSRRGHRR